MLDESWLKLIVVFAVRSFGIKSNDRKKKKPAGNEKYTANTILQQYYGTKAHKIQINTQISLFSIPGNLALSISADVQLRR